jgi:hypothetical protein
MHYVRGMVTHYMAAVQHILGNREAQADCYHAQVRRQQGVDTVCPAYVAVCTAAAAIGKSTAVKQAGQLMHPLLQWLTGLCKPQQNSMRTTEHQVLYARKQGWCCCQAGVPLPTLTWRCCCSLPTSCCAFPPKAKGHAVHVQGPARPPPGLLPLCALRYEWAADEGGTGETMGCRSTGPLTQQNITGSSMTL